MIKLGDASGTESHFPFIISLKFSYYSQYMQNIKCYLSKNQKRLSKVLKGLIRKTFKTWLEIKLILKTKSC